MVCALFTPGNFVTEGNPGAAEADMNTAKVAQILLMLLLRL